MADACVPALLQDFCIEAERAAAAHFARLTVNSEGILASLLEALDHNRTEKTCGQILTAVAAMAQSLGDNAELESPNNGVSGRGGGMLATLRKGLPAVARAVATVMECTARGVYTWKERKAALEVVIAFAALQDLRGQDGHPLGEHRARLIQGSLRCKRDSVAAVREAALGALAALEASETPDATPTGFCNSLSGARRSGAGMGGANIGEHYLKGGSNRTQMKHNLDRILVKVGKRGTVKEEPRSATAATDITGKYGVKDYRDIPQQVRASSSPRVRAGADTVSSLPQVLLDRRGECVPSPRTDPRGKPDGAIRARRSLFHEARDAPLYPNDKRLEDEELPDRVPRERDASNRGAATPVAHAADPGNLHSPRERVQDNNTRLLQHLHDKTDGIAIALHSLEQRLVGDKDKHFMVENINARSFKTRQFCSCCNTLYDLVMPNRCEPP